MKRRTFIKSGSLMTLPLFLNGFEVMALSRSNMFLGGDPYNDKVLILIELNGGNDGLNTFVPLDKYDILANLRSNILIPENKLLKISDTNAFHPSCQGFRSLYDEGKLGIIQSVAYPDQNRSHFRSIDIWNSASDAAVFEQTGWIGRYFQNHFPDYPDAYPNETNPDPFAITLGYLVSSTCQGTGSNYSFALENIESLVSLDTTVEGMDDSGCYGMELNFIKQSIVQSNAYVDSIKMAYDSGTNQAIYPDGNRLAEQLKLVARLISGGLKTKVFVVSQGGYDTHADQVNGNDMTMGNHANLLSQLSEALESFQKDVDNGGFSERVMGMTYSEFGRRIRSNFSSGTDHGTAAPLFVFGSCVNGGVFGDNPNISPDTEVEEGVAMQHDFRSVYASVLTDWLGASKETVDQLLFDSFETIDFLKDCNSSSADDLVENQVWHANAFPNPCSDFLNIDFESKAKSLKIDIYNTFGALMKSLNFASQKSGKEFVSVDMSHLKSGTYLINLSQGKYIKKSLRVIKL
ncbi:MAG TPA: DUF1501 domain-containing protein [Saprospiraceae bacterium]|nr:DUF1501 domain-containing protein [Saprospiraceae bacterium]